MKILAQRDEVEALSAVYPDLLIVTRPVPSEIGDPCAELTIRPPRLEGHSKTLAHSVALSLFVAIYMLCSIAHSPFIFVFLFLSLSHLIPQPVLHTHTHTLPDIYELGMLVQGTTSNSRAKLLARVQDQIIFKFNFAPRDSRTAVQVLIYLFSRFPSF